MNFEKHRCDILEIFYEIVKVFTGQRGALKNYSFPEVKFVEEDRKKMREPNIVLATKSIEKPTAEISGTFLDGRDFSLALFLERLEGCWTIEKGILDVEPKPGVISNYAVKVLGNGIAIRDFSGNTFSGSSHADSVSFVFEERDMPF